MSAKRLAFLFAVLGVFFAVVAAIKGSGSSAEGGTEEAARPVVVRVPVDGEEPSRTSTPAAMAERDDGRSVAERVRDATLAAKVKKALAQERGLRTFPFKLVVMDGVVAVEGSVRTSAQRARVAQVVRGVEGVGEVRNEVVAAEGAAPPLARQEPRPPEPLPASPTSAGAEPAADVRPAPTSAAYHTVAQGESLWIIAQRYGTSVQRVKRLNDLSSNNIQPGQELRVR